MPARMIRPDYSGNNTLKEICLDELANDLLQTLGDNVTIETCKEIVSKLFKG